MADDTARPLTTAQAARYLDRSTSWLEKKRVAGEGPRYLKVGGSVRYRAKDLDAYLNGCAIETTDSRKSAA